ncbi:MAG TPA: hypothetical protein PKK00_14010 [Bacteroidales bacterium]|nr:hypothetical protein [Bacteroidales bacterium]HPS18335.1 hypothetical protein [Bacteroidales bacterium]
MKKIYLWLSMMLIFVCAGKAQTNLYSNNFDALTVGGYAASQLGTPWTTWSNAPGGSEDGIISSTQSHSASNSVEIALNNDFVMNLNDKTTGRYKVEFYMYVATGHIGYYNILSDFNGSNSKWAFQIYAYDGNIYVDAGGASATISIFTLNTWNKMDLIVDLDDDFATFFINDIEKISYQWSKGAQGSDNSLKLDAIDFFGIDSLSTPTTTTSTSGYFIDDISIDELTAPVAPSNLVATYSSTTGNIDVTWTAPTTAPDLYKLSRNGNVIYSGASNSYTDVGPWPNNYGYAARAFFTGQGYSHSSNVDSAKVPGGVTRDLVLMEGGTGTW